MSYVLRDKKTLYSGRIIRLELHILERSEDEKVFQREIIVHPGAVVILPLHESGDITLIRNRRYAVGKDLIELPAGTIEKNEVPINAAGRELQEETGLLAGKLQPLGSFYSSPGILTEQMFLYVATDLTSGVMTLDDSEEITLMTISFDEAIRMISTGEIQDGKTITALLMYDLKNRRTQPAN